MKQFLRMKKIKTLNRLDIMLVNSVGDSEVLYMLTLLFATIGSSTLIAGRECKIFCVNRKKEVPSVE
ncbi:hypothetical protein DVW88_13285 [Enterococcus faecium]|nr:hypothetical protein DVW88_13285 [Enterococcus faecium]